MEINFVTGKGGVGKSAVAAALALKRARAGFRTILVELGDQSYFRDYFSLPSVGYQAQTLEISGVKFDLAQWSGQECLKEYILHIVKVESLYRLFFENAVTKALVNVAPALSELSILGKITSGPPRNVGPKMPYDVIVVDAYASGHFMALMNAPTGLATAIRFGSMGEQVRSIGKVLHDANLCKFFVVALPEELPVVEGLELAGNIKKVTGQSSKVLLNRLLPFSQELNADLTAHAEPALKNFSNYLQELEARQKSMQERILNSGHEAQSLPWILSSDAKEIIERLSRELQA